MRDGRDGRRGIEPPPLSADQRLGPRVGVGLANDHVAAGGIHLAALIAGDDPCRDAGRAQQHDEGAREVLAEAATALEQEGVDRIGPAIERRRERVVERFCAEPAEHGAHELDVVGVCRPQLVRELDRPRIGLPPERGQLQVFRALGVERCPRARRHRPSVETIR